MRIISKIKNNQYWVFTILVTSLILLPSLLQKGMFFDGYTYAAISKNLSEGVGSIFNLHYTKTVFPSFYEHPPLVIWLQSIFFYVFGDYYWVEKLFSGIIGIITVFGLLKLFNFFYEDKKFNWFIVFLLVSIPQFSFGIKNNILENTLSVFALFSVLCQLHFFKTRKFIYLILASLLIISAFLSKGLVGLFPLIVPILYIITIAENKKRGVLDNTLLVALTSVVFIIILYLWPELKEFLIKYFNTQVIPAIEGKREITTSNRFKILIKLFLELIVGVLILVLTLVFLKKKENIYKKESVFFLLLGLSASLPLVITLKQRGFYLIPSLPYYVLSLGFIVLPLLYENFEVLNKKKRKVINVVNLILSITLLIWSLTFDGYYRDKNMLSDVEKICQKLESGTEVACSKALTKDWKLISFFSRIKNISLTNKVKQDFFVSTKTEKLSGEITENYIKLNLGLTKYNLYQLKY